MDTVNQVSDNVKKVMNYVNDNKYLSAVLGIFLVLYAVLAAPKLPKSVAVVFDNTFFKLGYMFLIGYLVTKDPSVAIIAAAGLLITIQGLSALEASQKIKEKLSNDEPEMNIDMDIELPPVKAEIVTQCYRRVQEHMTEAGKAEQEGNKALAEAHMLQAQKQEAVAESVIKSEKHMIAAEVAKQNGQEEQANQHLAEAVKQEAKVEAVIKAEQHRAIAEEERQNGNVVKAEAHMAEAEKQEVKAEALHKAEKLREVAAEAEQKGQQEEAQQLLQMAVMEEAKAEQLIMQEAQEAQEMVEEAVSGPSGFDANEFAFPMVDLKDVVEPEQKLLDRPVCAEGEQMDGYPGNELANF